jgi:antitoxin YefM
MYATYQANVEELDIHFLDALKTIFKNKKVEIVVCETAQLEEDETAYLLSSPANRAHLLKAIENVAHNRNLVTVDLDEWQ